MEPTNLTMITIEFNGQLWVAQNDSRRATHGHLPSLIAMLLQTGYEAKDIIVNL